jgi:hypothetical protein
MGFTKFWRSASDISWEYLLGYLYIYIYYICNVYVYPTMMGNIEGI